MKIKHIILTSVIGASLLATQVHAATEWNVSLWGKQRAFTENVEKLAALVSSKTNGEFKLNISYGGLSKSKENLDGISFGAFEMAQFCSSHNQVQFCLTQNQTQFPFQYIAKHKHNPHFRPVDVRQIHKYKTRTSNILKTQSL